MGDLQRNVPASAVADAGLGVTTERDALVRERAVFTGAPAAPRALPEPLGGSNSIA
ncbi:hypothetical protein [Halorubrum cibi]|uniref:Uncharacterized protein n=1 Tax=Halorubrum cibi TaxID=413815 RepID=A0A521C3E2_9EURY|nr:hypothetical protein [Halorubrum cibi]SMO53923.1 hypothetical protein SAMN06264867_103280 [Halorubrum cibi]